MDKLTSTKIKDDKSSLPSSFSNINPDIDEKSVKLKINLELVEKHGSIAHVNQAIILPYLKEPAFVKGAYKQIENTLKLVGVDLFKRLVRQYFLNLADNFYANPTNGGSDLLLPMDSKMVITNSESVDQNPSIDSGDNITSEKLDLNLEVEEEENNN